MDKTVRKAIRKALSVFLCISMMLSFVPMTVFAEEFTTSSDVNNEEFSNESGIYIDAFNDSNLEEDTVEVGALQSGETDNDALLSADASLDEEYNSITDVESDVGKYEDSTLEEITESTVDVQEIIENPEDATMEDPDEEVLMELSSEEENPFEEFEQEGDWWYQVDDRFIIIRGYSGTDSDISVPSKIDNKDVTAIEGSILLEDNNVTRVYIPGNVKNISALAFINANGVTLRGYNGTPVLKYASQLGMASENMSTVSLENFDGDTVDYSYADVNAINIISESEVEMGVAEGALLTVGTKFYLPIDGGRVYKVAEIQNEDYKTRLSVDLIYPVLEIETEGLSDDDWIYEIADGYAVVLGYKDYSVTSLVIPDMLGGYYVNGIGEEAFVNNTALSSMRVHGNVINIANNAFRGLNVEFAGYNGTRILSFAKAQGYSYRNLTSVNYFELKEDVVDLSYADSSRYEITSESTVSIHTPEAEQLSEGSIFYIPETYGNLVEIYKVTGKNINGEWTEVYVTEATAEEALFSISVQESSLTPDWSRAEWSDEVELFEEKLGGGFELGASQNLKFTHKINDYVSFTGEGKLGITGKASFDFNVWQWELNSFEAIVEPYVQFKGELRGGSNTASQQAQNMHSQAESVLKDGSAFEVYLGKVPLVSVAKVIEVQAAIYVKVDINGKITFTIKGSGQMGCKYNKATDSVEGVNTWSWSQPTLDISGNLEIGPAEAVQLEIAVLGKVVSIDLFEGVTAGVKWSTENKECFDANVGYKIACTVNWKIPISKKWSTNTDVTLFSKTGKIGLFHFEIGKGFVENCTYKDTFVVNFNTTFSSVDSLTLMGGDKVTEPQVDIPGHTLDGWYTDKNYKTKWDFDNDTVTSDITLYAKWDNMNRNVTYQMNYEKADYSTTAEVGTKLTRPADPMWPDHVFEGWYKDAALTTEWNFSTDVMPDNDITLYAKWREEIGYDPYVVGSTSSGDVTFMGHSYTHIMTYMTYSEATAYAKDRGGYLATINSKEEQDFLAKYLYNDCAQTYLWLGMNSTGNWTHWATGEKVTYTNWESTPQMTSSQYNAALRRVGGTWTTLSNSDTAHFVIEWGNYSIDSGFNTNTSLDDIQYTIDTDSGTASVTGWNSDVEGLVIADVYNGYPVATIAAKAFQNNTKLKTIAIPSSVTTIGDYAFSGCSNLTVVNIPDSVRSIGQYVFQNCTSLGSVSWSSQLTTIPRYTFYGDTQLTAVGGIGSVKSIGDYAFYNCRVLSNISLPSGLETIGRYVFYNNYALPDIILPDTVTNIGYEAFYYCTSANTITISDKMASIPDSAFYNCNKVTLVNIPSTITSIGSNAFRNVNGTFRVYRNSYADTWAMNNTKTITYLGVQYRVVYSTNNSSSTNVPSTKAGNLADDAYVEVGKRIIEPEIDIDGFVIEGWYLDPEFKTKWDFANDKMPEGNITLYAKWVETDTAFDFDVIDSTVKITGYNGSNYNVIIPDTIKGYPVTAIAENAFVNDAIGMLTIPATVKSINGGAFDCKSLVTIIVNGNHFKVEDGILYTNSGKTLVYAPQGRTYATYTVADGTTMISARAFKDQENLKKIIIPDSVTSISSTAFEGNHTLTIYGSVNTCAAKTFAEKYGYDYNLYYAHFYEDSREVYQAVIQADALITDYYQPVGDFLSFGGWYKDSSLTTKWDFSLDRMPQSDLNLYLKWDSDYSFQVNGSAITITGYNGTLSDLIIPETINGHTVTGIAAKAFVKSTITSVTIPDCVVDIADGAFHTNVQIIANDSSTAHEYADSKNLSFSLRPYKVMFDELGGSLVTDIEVIPGNTFKLPTPIRSNYYFAGWYSDTSFSEQWTSTSQMPENDVTLYALWRIANINVTEDFAYTILDDGTIEITAYTGTKTSLSVPDSINGYTVSRIGEFAFNGNSTILTINIPSTVKSIGAYAFADTKIRTVKGAEGLTVIEEGAFNGNSGLRNLVIPAGVTSIGAAAFMSCSSITDVELPDSLTTIGNKAFYSCEFLDEVTFPMTLAHIGEAAFKADPRLLSVTIPISLINSVDESFDNSVNISYMGAKSISILSFVRGSQTTVTLSWNDVEGASKYAVSRKIETDASFKRIKTVTETETSVLAGTSGLTSSFIVIALDENGKTICESEVVSILLSDIETPSIASVTQKTSSAATMVLNKLSNVSGYEVYRSDTKNGDYTLLKSVTLTSFVNSGLIPGGDYYYKVRAYVEGADSSRIYSNWSDIYYFHMPYKYMTAPDGVTVRQTTSSVSEVVWNAVDGADGYIVYRSMNGGSFQKLKEVSTAQVQNVSLKVGNSYQYKVSAFFYDKGVQIVGPQSNASGITVQAIATPKITEILQDRTMTVSLKWSSVTGATGYSVYRSTIENGAYQKLKNVTTTETLNYTDLDVGTTYYYRIRAYVTDDSGNTKYGEMSPTASIKISSVAKVTSASTTQAGSSQIKVSWKALSSVDGYEVWFSANNENNYVLATDATSTSTVVSNLNGAITYYFKVRAYVFSGSERVYGEFSDTVDCTLLSTPVISVVEQSGSTSAELLWNKVDGADGYEVWRRAGDDEFKLLKTVTSNTTTCYNLTGNTLYLFKIRAYKLDEAGDKEYSFYSAVGRVRILGTTAISSIERTGTGAVTLTWNKVDGATGYDLYRSDTIDGVFKKVKTTTDTWTTHYGLTVGNAYYFKVIPYTIVNNVQQNGKASVVKGIRMLEKPVISTVEQTGSGSITLTWNEVPNATAYKVFRSNASTGTYACIKTVTDTEATALGLTAGKLWYFKIVAVSEEDGNTYESQESSIRSIYLTTLAKPSISSIEQSSATAVKITWGKVTNAKGYEVVRATSEDGPYVSLKTIEGQTLTTTNVALTMGQSYYYKVRPYVVLASGEKAYGMYSNVVGAKIVSAPKITGIYQMGTSSAAVEWSSVVGATSYNVYRATSASGAYSLIKTTTDTTIINYSLTGGNTYYYKVAAVVKDGTTNNLGPMSAVSNLVISNLKVPAISTVRQTASNTVYLAWKAVDGADGYEVSMANGDDNQFKGIKNVATTATTTSSGIEDGNSYQYRIRAYATVDGQKVYSGYSSIVSIQLMEKPEVQYIYQQSSGSSVLVWNEVSGASGYEVYRKIGNGSYSKLKDVTGATVTNVGLTAGLRYTYKIRAYKVDGTVTGYSGYSNEMGITPISFINATYPESQHEYSNNMDETWTYSISGAEALLIKFSSDTAFENSYDKLYITDANGNPVGPSYYTGTQLANAYIKVEGDTVNFRMTTDGSVTRFGFSIELIKPTSK
ncbi:MAG: leucine-rich repeat protein [Bacteroides sp.]|nr:leucine-rich repeat protein [Bacteroides sp.]